MKTAAKITGLLVGIFLVIGFVVTELRASAGEETVTVLALPLVAVAGLVGWFGIRRILRTARADH